MSAVRRFIERMRAVREPGHIRDIPESEMPERFRVRPITEQLLGPCQVKVGDHLCGLPFQDESGMRVNHGGHSYHKQIVSVAARAGYYEKDERSSTHPARFVEMAIDHEIALMNEQIADEERRAVTMPVLAEAFTKGPNIDYHRPHGEEQA